MYLQVLVIFCCCVINNFCSSYPDPRGSGRARATSEGDYLDSPNLSELEYHNYQPTNFNGVDVYNSLHPSLAGSGVPYHSDNPKPKTKKAKHRHGKRRRVTQEPDVKKPKRRRNKKRRGQKGEVPEDPDVPLIKNPDISTIEELTRIPQPQGTDVPAIQKPEDLKQVEENKKIENLLKPDQGTDFPDPDLGNRFPEVHREIEEYLKQVEQNKKMENQLKPDQENFLQPDQGTDFPKGPGQGNRFPEGLVQENRFPENQLQGNRFPENQLQENRFPENQLQENRFPENQLQRNRFPDIDWEINYRRNRTSVDVNPEERPCPDLEPQTVVPPYPDCGNNPDRNNNNQVICQDKHGLKHVNQGCREPEDPELPAIHPPFPNDCIQGGNNLIDCNDQLIDPNLGDNKEIHIPEEIIEPEPVETSRNPFSLHEFGHKIVHGLLGGGIGGIRKSAHLRGPGFYLDSHSSLGDGHLYRTQKSFDAGLVRGNLGIQLF